MQTLLGLLGFFELLEVFGVPVTLRNLGLLGTTRRRAGMQDNPKPSINSFPLGISQHNLGQPLFNIQIVDDSGDCRLVKVLVALELAICLFMPKTAIKNAQLFIQDELESLSFDWTP